MTSNATLVLWCINTALLALVVYKFVPMNNQEATISYPIKVVHPENISTTELDLDSVKDFKRLLSSYVKARTQMAAPNLPPSMLFISGAQRVLVDTGNATLQPMIWYHHYEPAFNNFLELDSISFVNKSVFQEVMVGHVARGGGSIISSDGDTQAYELDEQIYHEYLAITPLLYHASPKRVLVVGGGDMLALTQLIKDPRIEEIILVDIDQVIVDASQQYLHDVNKYSWKDPRVKIYIADGLKYLAETKDRFDIVIVDLLDAWTEQAVLLWAKVLELCDRVMKRDAILSSHSSSDAPLHLLHRVSLICKHYFRFVVTHKHVIRSFGNWGYVLASRSVDFEYYSSSKVQYRFDLINNNTVATESSEQIIKYVVPERYPSAYHKDQYDRIAIRQIKSDVASIARKDAALRAKKQQQLLANNTTLVSNSSTVTADQTN